MMYLKVKPEYDAKPIMKYDPRKKCYGPTLFALVANELFTKREAERYNIPEKCLKTVQVKKTRTYFSFGARFELKEDAQ